ncbi:MULTISPECIES: hypothetical protein [unclassified Thioalkalivibrio]|uniref:hypothetical protein n=1 Tax=unclassified Thioalkalivibrio TaxID=2621013 RepID=UPI000366059D|nr:MULTISPECIES: hypothetical protein [unclassified Thioalkalivibrio]
MNPMSPCSRYSFEEEIERDDAAAERAWRRGITWTRMHRSAPQGPHAPQPNNERNEEGEEE